MTIISVGLKEVLAQYAFFLGRKTGNVTVKADGWHHRTDAISSLVILIGILFNNRFWWIDSALGIAVSLMLFYAAFEIIKESINKILGENPSPELIKEVENIIERLHLGNVFPHHYHIHNYVSQKELSFQIKLNGNNSIREGHLIAAAVERNIYDQLCISTTVHVDPDTAESNGDI